MHLSFLLRQQAKIKVKTDSGTFATAFHENYSCHPTGISSFDRNTKVRGVGSPGAQALIKYISSSHGVLL